MNGNLFVPPLVGAPYVSTDPLGNGPRRATALHRAGEEAIVSRGGKKESRIAEAFGRVRHSLWFGESALLEREKKGLV